MGFGFGRRIVHYYTFHIGDYRKDTVHLTLLEHAIYRSLIDSCFETEQPLPLDHAKLMRSHSVRSEAEKESFNNVLADFFIETPDGYRNFRVDNELEKIYKKSEKARESAKIRWEKKAKAMQTDSERIANASKVDANAPKNDADGMLPINPLTHNPETKDKTISPSGSSIEIDQQDLIGDLESYEKPASKNKMPRNWTQSLVDTYHECLPDWPRVEIINDDRKKAASRAWKFTKESNTVDFWRGMFSECQGNKFMEGDNDRGWKGNFDYLLTSKAMVKIYEGNQPR